VVQALARRILLGFVPVMLFQGAGERQHGLAGAVGGVEDVDQHILADLQFLQSLAIHAGQLTPGHNADDVVCQLDDDLGGRALNHPALNNIAALELAFALFRGSFTLSGLNRQGLRRHFFARLADAFLSLHSLDGSFGWLRAYAGRDLVRRQRWRGFLFRSWLPRLLRHFAGGISLQLSRLDVWGCWHIGRRRWRSFFRLLRHFAGGISLRLNRIRTID